ncbi:MAG: hypothetical protein H8E35_05600 [Ardenticatenia bacterium]|nr:hypothetical protein [Ardenticatenia bacterium]
MGERVPRERNFAGYADADGLETVSRYACELRCQDCGHVWIAEELEPCPECGRAGEWECAVRKLGEQSGERPVSGSAKTGRPALGDDYGKNNVVFPSGVGSCQGALHNDKGTAARFFPQFDWAAEIAERLANSDQVRYQAKASRKERDAGLEGMEARPKRGPMTDSNWCGDERFDGQPLPISRNHHPTVKPIKLIEYLATLLLPPAAYAPRRILVPFAGVASEMIGCGLAGWEFVLGIEMEREYCDIARARLAHWLDGPQQLGMEVGG